MGDALLPGVALSGMLQFPRHGTGLHDHQTRRGVLSEWRTRPLEQEVRWCRSHRNAAVF